jgi:hypothetical protein
MVVSKILRFSEGMEESPPSIPAMEKLAAANIAQDGTQLISMGGISITTLLVGCFLAYLHGVG